MQDDVTKNIEIVRRLYPGSGYEGSIDDLLSPNVVGLEAEALPYAGRYEGKEGFKRLLNALVENWDDLTCTEMEFVAQNDTVIVLFRLRATARKTGVKIDQRVSELWKLKDGKIVFVQPFYFDTWAVRKVCGLS